MSWLPSLNLGVDASSSSKSASLFPKKLKVSSSVSSGCGSVGLVAGLIVMVTGSETGFLGAIRSWDVVFALVLSYPPCFDLSTCFFYFYNNFADYFYGIST